MAESNAEYTPADFAAAAHSLGCEPWDVAGIFRTTGKGTMTESEFRAALNRWQHGSKSRSPLPTTPQAEEAAANVR